MTFSIVLHCQTIKKKNMEVSYLIGLITSVIILAYLIYVLIKPEKF